MKANSVIISLITGIVIIFSSCERDDPKPTPPPATKDPVANFTKSATQINEGETLLLTNSSTDATSYAWEFTGASPETSSEASPVVTYATAGTYTIKLTATNSKGSSVKTDQIVVVAPVDNRIHFYGTITAFDVVVGSSFSVLSIDGVDSIIYLSDGPLGTTNSVTYDFYTTEDLLGKTISLHLLAGMGIPGDLAIRYQEVMVVVAKDNKVDFDIPN